MAWAESLKDQKLALFLELISLESILQPREKYKQKENDIKTGDRRTRS
jgi:hypothetical protein